VKDFELSSVSTYAGKYVGYGIEKGKLSANLNYKIEDRKLTATNQVFLDQLTFGDKVDSPSALKLPVLLAVSLLKNSRGEIDLDLPVGGSWTIPVQRRRHRQGHRQPDRQGHHRPLRCSGRCSAATPRSWPGWISSPALHACRRRRRKLQSIAKVMTDKPGLKLDIAGRSIRHRPGRAAAGHAARQGRGPEGEGHGEEGRIRCRDGRVTVSPGESALLTLYKDEKFPKPATWSASPRICRWPKWKS
jgi:hypothetical protein